MPLEVTAALVRQISALARLSVSPEEAEELRTHFEKILAFVEELQGLDTRGVDPSIFATDAPLAYREDEPGPSLGSARALANAPSSRPPYFLVPRIVGDPEATESTGGST